ncbi:GNAT family N-acetyltransferase [Nocardia sp. CDC153]|uniref:GNAT family N-acetyltransferase n=1 Tax=Nocardia sp. CDC153 TaxID=3112167 RepID=UPI002DB74BEE|nr:GNAT family N-acetyltransferase [Nocardia sp. CDC153]MEC3955259.1 GNAT family N-acetyltransferase [Nocardia sp. CDC153]
MDAEFLTDGTIWLSPPAVSDIDAITALCQEPSIGAWTTMPVPYQRADAEKFVYDIVGPGWAGRSPTWALRRFENGPVVGMIGLSPLYPRRDDDTAEIGYWLSPAARGQGLMTRAAALVSGVGLDPTTLNFERLEWRAFVGNHPSAAVVRRNGYHYEGLLRGGGLQRGTRRDIWVAGRLRTDPPTPSHNWPAGV